MEIQQVSYLTEFYQTTAARTSPTADKSDSKGVKASMGSSATSGSISDIYYDKMDLNKDGYVSLWESIMYALSHPGESTSQSIMPRYNPKGEVSVSAGNVPRLIDTSI